MNNHYASFLHPWSSDLLNITGNYIYLSFSCPLWRRKWQPTPVFLPPVDRGAWWAAVHRVAQSQTQLKRLTMHACIGEGNGNPLQYSCLENPRDRGAWWAAVYGVMQSRTQLKWLSKHSFKLLRQYFHEKVIFGIRPDRSAVIREEQFNAWRRVNCRHTREDSAGQNRVIKHWWF